MRRPAFWFLVLSVSAALSGQEVAAGEEAVAERYLSYALSAAAEGRWADAEETLERAADFASVSSDLSYYLALARRKLGRPLGSVLEAAARALEASRWRMRTGDEARLLAAECLIDLRSFDEALDSLSPCGESAEKSQLRLRALRGAGNRAAYLERLSEALAAYPRDVRIAALAFSGASPRADDERERRLVSLVLSRLPFLLPADPFLAVAAAPFVRDVEERRRLVAAYRAAAPAAAESLPAALSLALVSETDAVAELFGREEIPLRLLVEVHGLLRSSEARSAFERAGASYSGTLTADADADGRPEERTRMAGGLPVSFEYDGDQDGLPEWSASFADGLPVRGETAVSAESAAGRGRARIVWERYPYVASVALGTTLYRFPPAAFPFSPVRLTPMAASSSVRVPRTDPLGPRLTERTLQSFAASVERPGTLFSRSRETVFLAGGVPFRSTETLDGVRIAETEYEAGYPSLRRVDSDSDGRFETIVRFGRGSGKPVSAETDFDGDGIFEKETVE